MKHLNSQSLLASIKKDSEFRIFFCKDGQLFNVILNNEGLTIETAISQSISKFNSQYQWDLRDDCTCYQVFGARKSGKKKDDLPAFEKSQLLGQTCLKNFFLMPLASSPKLRSKGSIKSIQTQITLDSRPKNQISQNFPFGCFCYRKGSMK